MPTELVGALALRKALKNFAPDLGKETQKQIAGLLKPVVKNARGFIPSEAPLSGWGKAASTGRFPGWSSSEARSGIGYKTTPSKPNRKGFRALARIHNTSASGTIFETAGRRNANGREQAKTITVSGTIKRRDSTQSYSYQTSANKNYGKSNNPQAGSLFIQAINQYGTIVDANNQTGAGRRSKKMRGRAIYRAWKEDGGRTNAAVIKAIENARANFYAAMGYK
jgi:hypothetical protein